MTQVNPRESVLELLPELLGLRSSPPASVAEGQEGNLVPCIILATIWGEAACK